MNRKDPKGLLDLTLTPTITWGWGVALAEPTPIGEAIMAVGSLAALGYLFAVTESDPYVLEPVYPGRYPDGRCKPCPSTPPPWEAPGKKHGSTCETHWHWLEYHQNPVTCECFPKRMSGPKDPRL